MEGNIRNKHPQHRSARSCRSHTSDCRPMDAVRPIMFAILQIAFRHINPLLCSRKCTAKSPPPLKQCPEVCLSGKLRQPSLLVRLLERLFPLLLQLLIYNYAIAVWQMSEF